MSLDEKETNLRSSNRYAIEGEKWLSREVLFLRLIPLMSIATPSAEQSVNNRFHS